MMIAAVGLAFTGRRATELASPDDERIVQQATLFQVLQKSGDRTVGGKRISFVSALEIAVLVPGLKTSRRMVELHESHAPLD
jgi:hypothetical protein